MSCTCLDKIRVNLEKVHGEGSRVEFELKPAILIDPKATEFGIGQGLPPLYYTYGPGKKRKRSHVVFNFCPFCGKSESEAG